MQHRAASRHPYVDVRAGTVVLLHHGLWHGGRRNDTDKPRYMFKIRFNPTVPQIRLWDTDDLADPAVAEALRTQFPWYEQAAGRLELFNRARLWQALTGDETFDLDHWVTRVTNRPQPVRRDVPSVNGYAGKRRGCSLTG